MSVRKERREAVGQGVSQRMQCLRALLVVLITAPWPSSCFVLPETSSGLLRHFGVLKSQAVPFVDETVKNNSFEKKGALSMTVDELAEVLGGRGRARLAWDCYSIGIDPQIYFGKNNNNTDDNIAAIQGLLPACRKTQTMGREALERLASLYPNGGQVEGGVATLSHISRSGDDTTKLLLRLEDGLEVETVIIPWEEMRSTLCISSQVGCRQGCTFCATGRMGRLRSLSSEEILAQLFFARKICRLENLPQVTNIVFMGMGEPADNADAVTAAARILTDRQLFQLSASKVTISTVAPTPDSFAALSKAPSVLAWSVHAANDALRKRLVPTTEYSMTELRDGLIHSLLQRPQNYKRTAMLEVALMAGVNDGLDHAEELADFSLVIKESVEGCKLIVNLIPYNPAGRQDIFKKPSGEAVRAFQQVLWQKGVHAHIRTTRGDDEQSACGQLATTKRKMLKNQQQQQKV